MTETTPAVALVFFSPINQPVATLVTGYFRPRPRPAATSIRDPISGGRPWVVVALSHSTHLWPA
jgi:hypothetical protein